MYDKTIKTMLEKQQEIQEQGEEAAMQEKSQGGIEPGRRAKQTAKIKHKRTRGKERLTEN